MIIYSVVLSDDYSIKRWSRNGSKMSLWTTFGVPLFWGRIEGRIMVLLAGAWECNLGVLGDMRKEGEKGVLKWGIEWYFWTTFGPPINHLERKLQGIWIIRVVKKWVKSDILDHFWVPLFSGSNRGVYFGII